MRKLKLNPYKGKLAFNRYGIRKALVSFVFSILSILPYHAFGQCTPVNSTISGHVIQDRNFNGLADFTDPGQGDIKVVVYDNNQTLVAELLTDQFGYYQFSGLTDGQKYRIEFNVVSEWTSVVGGIAGNEMIQFVTAPACQQNLLVHNPLEYSDPHPKIALTKFIQGGSNENDNNTTLVTLSYDFGNDKTIDPISKKSQTGSIWGLAFSKSAQKLFSSAFVKQYAFLGPNGLGAIYQTYQVNGQYQTSLYVDLAAKGINLGQLSPFTAKDCEYGAQTGKLGLGGLDICEERKMLYTINIYNHSLLMVPVTGANASNIKEIALPVPGCANSEYYAFAVSYHDDKLYIGITCTAESSRNSDDMVGHIYEYDLETGLFSHIFETDYLKGYWLDFPSTDVSTTHWVTDISFTDEGNMVLSLSDRKGNRYCFGEFGRLDIHRGDILMVWNDNGTWKLENNGRAGTLTGTGVGNGEGPGGGEFFGKDAWPKNPGLHPETSIGSALVVEGTGEIIVPVYDPENSAYSGGLKKFNTSNGKQTGVVTIYEHKTYPEFGKAAGFGELALLCGALPVEVGNYVWLDENKNGVQDPEESGLDNIEISLYDAQCGFVSSTHTNPKGYYSFGGLQLNQQYYAVVTDPQFNKTGGYLPRDGMFLYPTVAHSGNGELKEHNDNDAKIANNVCPQINGLPYIDFYTQGSGMNLYNLDFGFSDGRIFDLALRKTLDTNRTVQIGDTVKFIITVYNQGTEKAHEIVITDYLNTGFIFDKNLNPGWKVTDTKAKFKRNEELLPGEQFETFIQLVIKDNESLTSYINTAEISSALDTENKLGNDIDSTPDDNPDNDRGGIPNIPNAPNPDQQSDDEINDDGTFDEDDHDPEWVRILDLALKKEVKGDKTVFLPGEKATFQFFIYNQGNETAESYEVTDYIPEGLTFISADNPGWVVSGTDMVMYHQPERIFPNGMQVLEITLQIDENVKTGDITNNAEISAMERLNDPFARDFDSTPNTDKMDDAGGDAGTITDNLVYNSKYSLIPDEDDADPAIIHIENFDLALWKKAQKNNAKPGELVTFEIEVFNQGTIPADQITIIDYIPDGLILEDANWTLATPNGDKASITLSAANGKLPLLGLTPGNSTVVLIVFRVDPGQGIGLITNFAEIGAAYDITGNNLGIYDEDSTPDDNLSNDIGGLVTDNQINDDGTLDEDDSDPAQIFISNLQTVISCQCLDNATNGDDGQLMDRWSLEAPSSQAWAAVLPLPANVTVNVLMEVPIGNGYSNYQFDVTHTDGLGYLINLQNNQGDLESIFRAPGSCTYADIVIVGPEGTCGGTIHEYEIENADPNATYTWTLSGGGSIAGSNLGPAVSVDWGTIQGTYTLDVQIGGMGHCQAPGSYSVTVGMSSGTLVARDQAIASFDQNCEVVVTGDMILTYGYTPGTPYSIMLIAPDGTVLPSHVITYEYMNIPLMVKIKDLCGGNSAMSTITAIDKLPPEFDKSTPVEYLNCYELDDNLGPVVMDNCDPNPQVILVNEQIVNLDCNNVDYSQEITRTYIAVDASGNQSEPFTKVYYTKRAESKDLDWPENLTVSTNSALVCGAYPLCPICVCDTFPYPDPLATGVPMLNNEPIYPSVLGHCQLLVGFTDVVMINTPCFKMVKRMWSVHEICEDVGIMNIYNHEQVIEIKDNIPPIPVAPQNIVMTTDGMNCGNWVQLPALEITDNCSGSFRVDIQYPGGFKENSNGTLAWLPAGINTVWYTIYDECGNFSKVEMTVTIEDHTPPVSVCQSNTVVALTIDGFAEVPAYAFDSGSYDDCTVVNMEVRRMDEDNTCGLDQNQFGPIVSFCCEDVGKNIVVVLRVWDENDNWNECMVNVEVQDNNAPILTIPPRRQIECTYPYLLEDLSEFGSATYYDVCGAELSVDTEVHLNDCGIGYIDRIFTVTDGVNIVSGTQRIDVVNSFPFSGLDIVWPEHYNAAESCDMVMLNPANLPAENGYPVINNEDYCANVSFTYNDEIYQIEQGNNACYLIIRTWTVMNWCHFVNGKYDTWQYEQMITVTNSTPPTIILDSESPIGYTSDGNCKEGNVRLIAMGDDDCSLDENLYWEYDIDLGNDGIIDESGVDNGGSMDLSGLYPVGYHSVYWSLSDYCGNTTHLVQYFSVLNDKKPTAMCIDHINVAIQAADTNGDGIADTENAYIEAWQFDAGSYHVCGYGPLTFSFSADRDDTYMWVDCSNVSSVGMEITLYVWDPFGNFDICTTTLFVQDNNNDEICDLYEDCTLYPDAEVFVANCDPDISPTGLGSSLSVSGDCPCQDYNLTYLDIDISDPDATCTTIQRNWTMSYDCGQYKVYTFQQIITIINVSAPELICGADIVVNAPANCEAFVTIPIPQISSEVCNTGLFITHNSLYADNPGSNASGTYPVGSTVVTFTLEDDCGNQAICDLTVTVNDITPPACVANDFTVTLDANGMATITAEDIDGGSTDACGIANLEVNPFSFDCGDVGTVPVVLTVTDVNGLSSTCMATVTVEDNSGALCSTQDITIILDGNGNYILDPSQIYTGSGCGGLGVTLDLDNDTFNCGDLGENVVILTVTEENGNSESCEAIVTVTDTIAPVCQLMNIDVFLDENGMASVTFDDINDGTYDPCGEIIDTTITNTEFGCGEVGEQVVIVTCEDNNGNISICEAIVTVMDTIAPLCSVQNLTVLIGASGQVTVTGDELDNGSTDECGISSITVEPNVFTCANLGDNEVLVTVTDVNGVSSICNAIVTVEDNSGPLCATQDIAIILDGNGQYLLDPEQIYTGSPCGSGEVTLQVVPELLECQHIGETTVTLTVTDEFGFSQSCTAIVTVSDTLGPICEITDFDLYLDPSGNGVVTFADLDNGSMDPCGEIVDINLSQSVFDCGDLGDQTVTVTLTDNSNNTSICNAVVTVIDTIAPVCLTNDFILDLDMTGMGVLLPTDIDGGSFDQCTNITLAVEPDTFYCNDVGTLDVELIVTDQSFNTSVCTATIEVRDVIPPQIFCPEDTTISCTEWPITNYSLFGTATATDECAQGAPVSVTVIENVNDCGIGIITRNFSVTDNSFNTSTCTQIITLEAGPNQFSEANILWGPETITTDGCTADLEPNTIGGAPGYQPNGAQCYLLDEFHADTDLNPDEQCMDTILRVWTVIDYCQYDPLTGAGIWTMEQTILAIDTILPEIVANGDTTICQADYIDLHGYATDCGTQDNVTVTNDSPYADNPNSADASGTYPFGEFVITITATDLCGNVNTHTYELIVYEYFGECKKVIRDIDDTGTYVLYLDEVFYPNVGCYDPGFMQFSLSPTDPLKDTLHYHCDALGGADFVDIEIPIYRFEGGVFIEEYCQGLLTLEDPNGFCGGSGFAYINGQLATYAGQGIEDASVYLVGSESQIVTSDDAGQYAFPAQMKGSTFQVRAERNDDLMNGVSTLDLIYIQRHLLGIDAFQEPYKFIAADVNRTASVSAADIYELRNLILGVTETLKSNTSWRFIPSDYQFMNPVNPLVEDFPEQVNVDMLNSDLTIDFRGIKIGDVNGSAHANNLMGVEARSNEKVLLHSDIERLIKGEYVVIPVSIHEEQMLNGLQMTIHFDPESMSFEEISGAELDISPFNYGVRFLESGLLTISWNTSQPIQLEKGAVLFNLHFLAREHVALNEVLSVDDDIIKSEWYGSINDVRDIEFRAGKTNEFELFQNTPNPWSNMTEISYKLPEKGNVDISIRDIYGQVIRQYRIASRAGLNTLIIDQNDFDVRGILIFELDFKGVKLNKKMIKIN